VNSTLEAGPPVSGHVFKSVVDRPVSANRSFVNDRQTAVQRVSESGFVDDGGLIVTRNCAFAHIIGPKKDKQTHIRRRRLRDKVFVNVTNA